jgi:Uma2 family endonuclease
MSVSRFKDLDLSRQYSYADYLSWTFKERVELLRGWVAKMSPAPNRYHQQISVTLSAKLFQHFEAHRCFLYTAPFDVRLPTTNGGETVVQPDLCIVCDESKLTKQGCTGSPDWIIEILSPGNMTKEMRDKFELYQESGVREYWIVEPQNRHVLRYALRDGIFIGLPPKIEDDEAITSEIFPDFSIAGKVLFGG